MGSLFDFEHKTDHYAVMGNPISHSKSPKIHQLFAQQTHQNIDYQAIQVDDGGFPQAVGNFFANGGKGLNITVPFKQQAFDLVDHISDRAKLSKAVNTLAIRDNGEIFGDNTDGIGLVRDLEQNHNISLANKSLLLVGAGGAARGIIPSLIESGIRRIHIVNRTAKRADDLRDEFISLMDVEASSFESMPADDFDIIINASASSLQGEIPPIPDSAINPHTCCYDLMYAAEATSFLRWAASKGIKAGYDGLGMLVEQAAESFYIWRGKHAQTAPVIQALKAEMRAQ